MSKNKEKQKQKPMPPFNNKPNTTTFEQNPKVEQRRSPSKPRTLEDFAKEVFEQLNERTNKPKEIFSEPTYKEVVYEPKAEPKQSLPVKVEPVVTPKQRESRPTLDENRSSKRNDKQVEQDVIKQNEIGSYVPKTKQALVQAIIASEIIGPPKAKQR